MIYVNIQGINFELCSQILRNTSQILRNDLILAIGLGTHIAHNVGPKKLAFILKYP